ncbi:GNAT family N-acetyltransferase [Micromonospora sp. B11E3]|uniref:GNAT family N-acetyltransferase n=1 Tax=Micromonospora sp. B11E3 TaxID=3153562 RepID=UPI00325D0912
MQQDLVAVADDVVDGEPGDPADGLGVEQQDHRGDPGAQRGAVVGEELAETNVSVRRPPHQDQRFGELGQLPRRRARMLDTGRYVGVREAGELVAVAGVHVFSPTWRVAALGNVTTHPRARGRGLAAAAVAALCARLRGEVDHVTLNVRADNAAAVRLYERLGFTRVADFTECALHRRA